MEGNCHTFNAVYINYNYYPLSEHTQYLNDRKPTDTSSAWKKIVQIIWHKKPNVNLFEH